MANFGVIPRNEDASIEQPPLPVEPSPPPPPNVSSGPSLDSQPVAKVSKRSSLSSFLSNDAVTKAEVLWSLQIITKHQSYRSCDKLRELFQEMFSDSDIARSFTLSPTKATYVIVYGLAPYFRSALDDVLKNCDAYRRCPSSI